MGKPRYYELISDRLDHHLLEVLGVRPVTSRREQLTALGVDSHGLDDRAGRYLVIPTSRFPDERGVQGRAFGNVIKVSHARLAEVSGVLT